MSTVAFCCFGLFVLVLWVFTKSRKKARLPPGPKGSLIFGNALQLDLTKFAVQLGEIGKDLGDAYTVRFFNKNFIILNSFDIIKEVMTSPKYAQIVSGRPPTFLGDYIGKGDVILQTYSENWTALRKIMYKGLRTYGTHRPEVENLVQTELKHVMSRIHNEAGNCVDPYNYINGYTISILSMLLTGRHLKQDDPYLLLCSRITDDIHVLAHPVTDNILMKFPWLRHGPFDFGKTYRRLKKEVDILRTEVHKGRENCKNREPCFLDFMLEEEDKGHVTEEAITGVLIDLFAAGTATTRTTLYTLLLVLTLRPDVQRKVQEEIDRVLGRNFPSVDDKHKMPYTQSVLWELYRLYPGAPFTSPHCTMEDVHIRDYFLPKDTSLYYNIWNVLHDEKFWTDTWEFKPSRFLDDSGDIIPPEDARRQRMIAFGLGGRLCMGEVLVRRRIFMACVAILQNFDLRPAPGVPLPSLDPRTFDVHFILAAPPYRIIFHPRVSD